MWSRALWFITQCQDLNWTKSMILQWDTKHENPLWTPHKSIIHNLLRAFSTLSPHILSSLFTFQNHLLAFLHTQKYSHCSIWLFHTISTFPETCPIFKIVFVLWRYPSLSGALFFCFLWIAAADVVANHKTTKVKGWKSSGPAWRAAGSQFSVPLIEIKGKGIRWGTVWKWLDFHAGYAAKKPFFVI